MARDSLWFNRGRTNVRAEWWLSIECRIRVMYPSWQHSSRLCLSVCYRVYCSRQTNPPHFRLCAQPPKSHATVVHLSPLFTRNTICIVWRIYATFEIRVNVRMSITNSIDAFSCKMFILFRLYPQIKKKPQLVKHSKIRIWIKVKALNCL